MIPRHTFSTTFLALSLPAALMWAFTACVLSCSATNGEPVEHQTASFADTSWIGDDCKGCPLSRELSFGLPGRQNLFSPTNDDTPVFAVLNLVHGVGSYFKPRLLTPPPGSDPPLERLFVLRI